MEEIKSDKYSYLIPANVSARFEFIDGFGWRELILTALGILLGFMLYTATGVFKKTVEVEPKAIHMNEKINENGMIEKKVYIIPLPIRLFLLLICAFGSFTLVKKDPRMNMSVYEILLTGFEFGKKQKKYLYEYRSGGDN